MDRPTFSQSWSRVSRLTPGLRPQVQIHRQLYRGEPWHVVHDAVSNNFFRLNPIAYHFVGLLDGRRSVEDAWKLTLERYGDAAPTQNEVIGLLGQLNQSNLLRVDLPADAAPLLERQRRRVFQQWSGQLMSIFSLRFPLFNPDRMLKWLSPIARPFLSKWGLFAWFGWIIYVLYRFLPEVRTFAGDSSSVLAPSNWAWMIVVFILVKSWHELGHGLVCRRFGGAVPEVGIMLLVLFPAPYVDATSSWNFPDKWKRLLVGAAGMMFELVVAGIAALVWLHEKEINPGSLTQQLSYNVVFLASVTTLLFNANPLLRFDGYYMLSDLLEIPNLYERSGRQLRWLFQCYGFGMNNVQPVSSLSGERFFLGLYGVLSQIYRVLVMISIALFIAQAIPTLGLAIAAWSIISWAAIPTGKFLHWLVTSPSLHDNRTRAITVTIAIFLLIVVPIGMIPVTEDRMVDGVVESQERTRVSVQADGFVKKVFVESGDRVSQNQIILVMENRDLEASKRELEAKLKGLQVETRMALTKDPLEIQIANAKIKAVEDQLADVKRRINDLTLRAPQAGVLVGGILKQWEGRYLQRGEAIASIENTENLRVTSLIDQAQNDMVSSDKKPYVELRTAGRIRTVIPSKIALIIDAGQTELPHPSMGFQGGGKIATKPEDRQGQTALRPQFTAWLNFPTTVNVDGKQVRSGEPGERVYVRFTLQDKRPLLFQWIRLARQLIRDRLGFTV